MRAETVNSVTAARKADQRPVKAPRVDQRFRSAGYHPVQLEGIRLAPGARQPTSANPRAFSGRIGPTDTSPAEPLRIWTKLEVSEAGDALEQEADRAADQVMRMPAAVESAGATGNLGARAISKPGLSAAPTRANSNPTSAGPIASVAPALSLTSTPRQIPGTSVTPKSVALGLANPIVRAPAPAPATAEPEERVQRDALQREDETDAREPEETVQRACASCVNTTDDEDNVVQRSPRTAGHGQSGVVSEAWSQRFRAVQSRGGEALSPQVRTFMEPRFQADFGLVRVHRDASASALAASVQARAFTVGYDVFFKHGEFQPQTSHGQRLIAHELAHVVQQAQGVRAGEHSRGMSNRVSDIGRIPLQQRLQRKFVFFDDQLPAVQKELHSEHLAVRLRKGIPKVVEVTARGEKPGDLDNEILWSLAHSRVKHFCLHPNKVAELVEFRKSIVASAIEFEGAARKGGHVTPGVGQPGLRVNERFWEIEKDPNTRDVTMRTKEKVSSSAAIDDVYEHPEMYAHECVAGVEFVQFHAHLSRLRRTMPTQSPRDWSSKIGFNDNWRSSWDFPASPTIHRMSAEAFFDWRVPVISIKYNFDHKRRHKQEVEIKPGLDELGLYGHDAVARKLDDYDDLIPGDQTTLLGPDGFVENVIYLGRGRFFGHLYGIGTVEEIAERSKHRKLTLGRARTRPWTEDPYTGLGGLIK